MKIKVTQKHIDEAEKLSREKGSIRSLVCPVALALADALGKKFRVGYSACWSTSNQEERYKLPEKVTSFIISVDNNEEVKPFAFTLRGAKA